MISNAVDNKNCFVIAKTYFQKCITDAFQLHYLNSMILYFLSFPQTKKISCEVKENLK